MDLDADARNFARAEESIESNELGEYDLVTFEVRVAASTWDTIVSSTVDAAMFVSWLESKRTD